MRIEIRRPRGWGAKKPSACVICLWPQWGYSLAWVAQFSRSLLKDLFCSHHSEFFFLFPSTLVTSFAGWSALLQIAPANLLEKVLAIEESTHQAHTDNARFQALNGQGHIPCWELANNKSVWEEGKSEARLPFNWRRGFALHPLHVQWQMRLHLNRPWIYDGCTLCSTSGNLFRL